MKHTRDPRDPDPTRRALLQAMLTIPALGISACADNAMRDLVSSPTSPTTLDPTPACDDGDDVTPSQTEGPYFKPSSPERTSLVEAGLAGTRLLLTGRVLFADCTPVARALLDFWQADDAGSYDLTGFRLRGHQFADDAGRYTLETIVPGLYPGRTRHIHVKVQAPGQPILTTQLYFPNEPRNGSDGLFSAALLMTVTEGAASRQGAFTFVLRV